MRNNWRSVFTVVISVLIAISPSNAHASFLADDLYIPAVGRGAGAAGSNWYTTVWFHNPGADEAMVTVSLLLRGQPNPTPDTQVFAVPAHSSVTFEDAIIDLFGLDAASGAFRVQSTGSIAVGSRIFNQPGNTISESQGQFMAGMPARFSIVPGQIIEVPGILDPADETFRSNFGMVETSGSSAQIAVTLLDGSGMELASKSYTLGPYAAFQRPLSNLAPDASIDGGILRFEVTGAAGAVLAYASAVANGVQSQDPTTLEMTLDPMTLGAISAIEAGPGLAGGGNEGVVVLQVVAGEGIMVDASGVSIADEGIKADHIAPGELVLGAKVGSEVLTDIVTFQAGNNINVEVVDDAVEVTAFGCFGERQEMPVTQALVASSSGDWIAGNDRLDIPGAGRWRLGYRVLVEVYNNGISTVSDPVNIALYDLSDQVLLRKTLSVLGLQVDLGTRVYATVSGESVVEVDRATTIALAARTSRNETVVTVHPHDFDLSGNLPNPDATSFFYIECLHRDD